MQVLPVGGGVRRPLRDCRFVGVAVLGKVGPVPDDPPGTKMVAALGERRAKQVAQLRLSLQILGLVVVEVPVDPAAVQRNLLAQFVEPAYDLEKYLSL